VLASPGSGIPVAQYVSVTPSISRTTGTVPPMSISQLADTDLVGLSGPSLVAHGPKLVKIFPEIHNTADCTATPPTATASSVITPRVQTAFGDRVLVANGPSQTVTGVTGSQLGLATVSSATLIYTLTKAEHTTGVTAQA